MRFAPKMSVRLRATLSATAVVALALGVASYVLVGVLSRTLQDNAADAAFARADAVVSELSTEPGVAATPSAGVIFNPDVQVRGPCRRGGRAWREGRQGARYPGRSLS